MLVLDGVDCADTFGLIEASIGGPVELLIET